MRVKNNLREKLFSTVMDSEWTGREKFSSGDSVNRLEEDIRIVAELLCRHIPGAVITAFQLLAASAYLMYMAPGLLWILIALMVIAVIGSRMFFLKLRKLTSDIRSLDSDIQQLMQENLQNRAVTLTIVGTARIIASLGDLQARLQGKNTQRLNLNAVARGFMGIGFMGGYAATFLWGVIGIRNGSVSFGLMTAFLQLVGQVQRPVSDLASQLPTFIHSLTSIERLMELDALPEEKDAPEWIACGPAGVHFENVSFVYEAPHDSKQSSIRKNIFKSFSYDFQPGTLTVIAGPTGAGKSTLVRLILGLLKPQAGSVTLYDRQSSCCASKSTRRNFRYTPQGNSLMSGTIRSNLLLADANTTEAQMRTALHTAVADFVFALPDGLDTVCGESGSGLSEGQCQRIAIARSLLQKGGIMLLDEATSALDPETEARLLSNLRAYSRTTDGKKLTIIFVSHREAVMTSADKVLTI